MAKKNESTAVPGISAPKEIRELVEKFGEHRETYRRPGYNETQLRQDFLDPFFMALGWDIYNRAGIHENYRDVILEQALRVEKTVKAPDYCIRIGPVPKFFVEAKKPAIDIKSDIGPAFQLRRYAWTAKLPLSILTDFEEFAVYDCRVKPDKDDSAATARVMLLSYTDYIDRWGEIADIFSREAVLKGRFDDFAGSTKKKRGTAEVDQAFLEEIETWREALAKNLSLRNESITDRELNAAVQLIIDRVIFLRMCEGREIEPYGRLQSLLNGEQVYPRLVEMFHRADEKYNSGLFHFQRDKDREPPDELTPDLAVDDKVLKDIVRRLYYPESPYEFAALPADILGQVYEQFLGKVIRLTAGHRAKIEEKPEVRKAGGVYYTPTYIVEYIVENTVGKLVEGKTPQEVGGLTATYKEPPPQPSPQGGGSRKGRRPLSVLDPACGSGSFLIVAYQYLLDWYLKQYIDSEPEKHAKGAQPRVYRTTTGDWRLTIAERKRILLAHIYGVDIDSQAVEVTKLSLLLKVLEGETEHTIRQLEAFHKERALPDLANNIKCGNSLIGPDFYEGKQRELFDEADMLRINAFDWKGKHGFRDIFSGDNPGFDAMIGNPPYVRQEGVSVFKEYLSARYRSFHGLADLYVYFLERGIELLRQSGTLGVICSGKFIQAGYGRAARTYLSDFRIRTIVDYGDMQLFRGATTYPVILVVEKIDPKKRDALIYSRATKVTGFLPANIERDGYRVAVANLALPQWLLVSQKQQSVLDRFSGCAPLSAVAGEAQLGVKTSLNEVFVVNSDTAAEIITIDENARDILRPFTRGRDITKWLTETNGQFLVCTREAIQIDDYPSVKRYLLQHEVKLRDRYEVRRGDYEWWVIRQVAHTDIFERPKIMYPDLASRAKFAMNTDGTYPSNTAFCIPTDNVALLAYLNSKLTWFWITRHCPANRGAAYRLFNQYINNIPVHSKILDHVRLNTLGRAAIDLSHRVLKTRTEHERTAVSRQIEHTDAEIDRLVYELYGLSEEEIALVEGATT